MSSRAYFKGKRIALVGLGAHGELVDDAEYLIRSGAWVSIYDLRSEARLKQHLVYLRSVGLANYVCGSIPAEDLLDMDIIILSSEYPRSSSFLKGIHLHNDSADENNKKKIAIEYPETLFFRLAPPVTVVGVLGPAGKTTVISMLEPMLKHVCDKHGGQSIYVVDSESPIGVLARLKKIKSGDIVLMRIPDTLIPELYAMRISPHVAVCTGLPVGESSMPFEVLAYQTYNNFLVGSDEVIDAARSHSPQPRAKMLRTKASLVPDEWEFLGRGQHDRLNAAVALEAARLFKIDDDAAQAVLNTWKPPRGRLELIKKVKGVEYYNDASSSTPESIYAALVAMPKGKKIVLIIGGADTGREYRALFAELPRYVSTLIVLPGSGTIKYRSLLTDTEPMSVHAAPSIEEAVRIAAESTVKGDAVLYSPGFDAGGVDGSRKERGERFVRAVRSL